MSLDKIIEVINIPKRIVDGTELFLRKLLGPAINESGQLLIKLDIGDLKIKLLFLIKLKICWNLKELNPNKLI